MVTEFTPTDRAVLFRCTFPENDHSYIVVDAFDKGSYVKILPEQNRIIGYTCLLYTSGGVFQQVHKSYLINLEKIEMIDGNRIIAVSYTHLLPIGKPDREGGIDKYVSYS